MESEGGGVSRSLFCYSKADNQQRCRELRLFLTHKNGAEQGESDLKIHLFTNSSWKSSFTSSLWAVIVLVCVETVFCVSGGPILIRLVTCWIVPRSVLLGSVISCFEWLEIGTLTQGWLEFWTSRRPFPELSCARTLSSSVGYYKTRGSEMSKFGGTLHNTCTTLPVGMRILFVLLLL